MAYFFSADRRFPTIQEGPAGFVAALSREDRRGDWPFRPAPYTFYTSDKEIIRWIKAEHAGRRNLTQEELVEICGAPAPKAAEEAAERKRAGVAATPGSKRRAAEVIQDEVEKQTGQRPTQKQARQAAKEGAVAATAPSH